MNPVPDQDQSFLAFFDRFWLLFVGLALGAILVLGVVWLSDPGFLFGEKTLPSPPSVVVATPTPSPEAEIDTATAALEEQGTSDEVADIEADLQETNLADLDQELTEIEAELTSP